MYRTIGLVLVLLASSSTALAQDDPRPEVFTGFSYLRTDDGLSLYGGEASTAFPLWAGLSIEGAVSGQFGSREDRGGSGRIAPESVPALFPFAPFSLSEYRANVDQYLVAGGPKYSLRRGAITPYVHLLVGVAHRRNTVDAILIVDRTDNPSRPPFAPLSGEASQSSFAVVAGAGADFRISERVAIRGVVDYVSTRFQRFVPQGTADRPGQQNNLKVATGIVFRF